MKECRCISDHFFEVCDGPADLEAERAVREHIAHCVECRDSLQWYGLTVKALSSLDEVSPPKDFVLQLNSRLDQVGSESYWNFLKNVFTSTPYLPLPIGAAAVALVVVLGVFFYNDSLVESTPKGGRQAAAKPSSTAVSATAQIDAVRPGKEEPAPSPAPAAIAFAQGDAAKDGPTEVAQKPEPLKYAKAAPDRPVGGGVEAKSIPEPRLMGPTFKATPPRSSGESKGVPIASRAVSAPDFSHQAALPRTVADKIGADNLTVESASIQTAVDSVKKWLPGWSGRVIEDKPFDNRQNEFTLGVVIPSRNYGRLASELVNYGAVESGAGPGIGQPRHSEDDHESVVIYIRFMPPRRPAGQ
jgi:hypothetical protein